MKIGQIISTPPFAWATGGCARVAYDLSRELARRGNDVTILTTDLYMPGQRYDPFNSSNSYDGIKILRFKYISDWLAWGQKIYFSVELIKYLKKHISEYEIIHLQDLISIHAFATMILCKRNNIPYVLTPHGSIPWLFKKKLINIVYNLLCGKLILKYATRILALNEMEVNQCKELGISEHKIEIVPNGVLLLDLESLPRRGEFREKYSIVPDKKIILYLGRIHKIKGIGILLDAFSDLKDNSKVVLVIVGPDDGYLKKLQDKMSKLKIENQVILTGPLYNSDKASAYIDADVYVLPSSYETFPITVLEAYAYGTPVIVTDRCGIANVVENRAGLVVPYDKDHLRDAILHMLSDEKMREDFIKNGKLLISKTFNWEKIAENVECIYSKCVFSKDEGGVDHL